MHTRTARPVAATVAVLTALLLASCGGDQGLSRSDVADVVRDELDRVSPVEAGTAQPDEPDLTLDDVERAVEEAVAAVEAPPPGLSAGDVAEIVGNAIAGIEPGITAEDVAEIVGNAIAGIEPGITAEDVARVARGEVASIPPKSAAAAYTKFFVDSAISRYQNHGLDAVVGHFNNPDSIDGQWYGFIIDAQGTVVSHFDPTVRGENLDGPLGTDVNGYNFGPAMLEADETGRWVSYVFRNPESGAGSLGSLNYELKNAWVKRHDGLLFGSGWYIDADEFTRALVAEAVEQYRASGLQGVIDYYDDPDQTGAAGLVEAANYYNTAETVEGEWHAFIADRAGIIVTHFDTSLVGLTVDAVYGLDLVSMATPEGTWTDDSTAAHLWLVSSDGMVFGSGWYNPADDVETP